MKIYAALLSTGLAACQFAKPLEEQHPSIQRAPGSVDDSEEAKREALARTVAADLGCAHADVVLTFPLRYANSAGLRYVVEGCGIRAMYAESCEAYPSCRYLLVSSVPATAAPKASGSLDGGAAVPRGDSPQGRLAPEAIKTVLRAHAEEWRRCYEAGLRASPNLSNSLSVKFVIAGDGHVSSAGVEQSDLVGQDTAECILERVRRLQFPAPEGGGPVTLVYPFVVHPGD